jgi:hypothetical protein
MASLGIQNEVWIPSCSLTTPQLSLCLAYCGQPLAFPWFFLIANVPVLETLRLDIFPPRLWLAGSLSPFRSQLKCHPSERPPWSHSHKQSFLFLYPVLFSS